MQTAGTLSRHQGGSDFAGVEDRHDHLRVRLFPLACLSPATPSVVGNGSTTMRRADARPRVSGVAFPLFVN